MGKSRKKKQRQQAERQKPEAIRYMNPYEGVESINEAGAEMSKNGGGTLVLRPGNYPKMGLRRSILESIIFSAKHLGAFNEQMAEKVRKGQTRNLYIDVPSLVDDIERFVRSYHPEPRRTPADGAAATMANDRSEEVPAIPMPLFGLKKQCSCGRRFWKLRNYQAHYAHEHIVLGTLPL